MAVSVYIWEKTYFLYWISHNKKCKPWDTLKVVLIKNGIGEKDVWFEWKIKKKKFS